MAKLRINDIPASAGQGRRVEVTWEDGRTAPRVAVAEFDDAPDEGDGERIRWYLEDYAEFPADPAPLLARAAGPAWRRPARTCSAPVEQRPGCAVRDHETVTFLTMRTWSPLASKMTRVTV
jgi:hypothetical protein